MTTESVGTTGGSWAPDACTLPTAEQPLRVAEFDRLFRDGVLGVERVAPTRVRLVLDPGVEVRARELVERETSCCSFFGFGFGVGYDGRLVLEVTVPPGQVEVLDGLVARAVAAI